MICEIMTHLSEFLPTVLRRLKRRFPHSPDIDDACQEAILAVAKVIRKKPQQFKSNPGGLVNYLYSAALNEIHKLWRRKARRPVHSPATEDLEARPQSDLDWGDDLSVLGADAQRLVIAFYRENRSLAEIARMFGVTVGAVKLRLHRARNRLRQHLYLLA